MKMNASAVKFAGRVVRVALRQLGVGLYHLGLAHTIIRLSPNKVRTLLYHAIEPKPNNYVRGLNVNVTPETFALHMDYVSEHYSVEPVSHVISGKAGDCPLVLTFDDGYASVKDNALPILEKRHLPATVYLIGTAVEGGMVWVNQLNHARNCHAGKLYKILADSYPRLADVPAAQLINHVQTLLFPSDIEKLMSRLATELPVDKQMPKLFSTQDDIKNMQSRGISFGFHTHDHYNLCQCNDVMLDRQLDPGTIRHLLDSNTFAYPFGYFSKKAIHKLTQLGYEQLMTVGTGNTRSSLLHRDRSEIFATSKADIFAQLEIVEPVMARTRSAARRFCEFWTAERKLRLRNSSRLPGDTVKTRLSMENDIPETSKPR